MYIHWSYGDGVCSKSVVSNYPGGEPLIADFLRSGPPIQKILMRPTTMLDLMGGLFFADALAERGQWLAPELILPFVPGARQDRLNDEGDYLFTAKSVAKEINARGFRRVTIFDPHSEVMPALIDSCRVVHAHECYGLIGPDSYMAVVSPDAGAEKRAAGVARKLGLPLLHGWKSRNVSNGRISGFGLEPCVPDGPARVLVVDDICDGGGTFMGLGKVINDRMIKADLYVTHGIFSQGTAELLRRYCSIICTDSIDVPREGVRVIPVCKQYMGGVT